MPDPSILDARLAEIDRRLRMIQSGLESVADGAEDRAPEAQPPAALGEHSAWSLRTPAPLGGRSAPPPPPPPPRVQTAHAPLPAVAGDDDVAALTARLSELTAAHERLLATTQNLLIEQADRLARAAPVVSVSAGPFTDTRALREFQHALAGLPQVREVTVREYVGSESVVVDVRLGAPIS